jgi:hypothetical protein
MTTELDRATDALFPSTGNRVGNIKFMRGRRTGVTAEQLAEQLNRADSQVREGLSTPVADIDNYCPSN